MSDLIEKIERRLKSANSVPVERTYITADEWAAIAKTLREKLSESGEITRLQSEVEMLRGRCGELSNLCERLQHCAQGFYVDQGDYGHMEAIMKDYHWIMRASKPWRDAFKKRIRAEGVIDAHNAMSDSFVLEATGAIQERAILRCQDFLNDYAQRLRAEADQMEGGEHG